MHHLHNGLATFTFKKVNRDNNTRSRSATSQIFATLATLTATITTTATTNSTAQSQ